MNKEMLAAVAGPHVDVDLWLPLLQKAMDRFAIDDDTEQAAFLANAAHESGEFTTFSESLNYSYTALLGQWPNRFSLESAVNLGRVDSPIMQNGVSGVIVQRRFIPTKKHAANQPEIANAAYGGRFGNDAPGDGWKFKGRGIFQTTFHANYLAYATEVCALEVMDNPDLLLQPEHAAMSAAYYWNSHKLSNVLVKRGFTAVCTAINGGNTGLAARTAHFNELIALA